MPPNNEVIENTSLAARFARGEPGAQRQLEDFVRIRIALFGRNWAWSAAQVDDAVHRVLGDLNRRREPLAQGDLIPRGPEDFGPRHNTGVANTESRGEFLREVRRALQTEARNRWEQQRRAGSSAVMPDPNALPLEHRLAFDDDDAVAEVRDLIQHRVRNARRQWSWWSDADVDTVTDEAFELIDRRIKAGHNFQGGFKNYVSYMAGHVANEYKGKHLATPARTCRNWHDGLDAALYDDIANGNQAAGAYLADLNSVRTDPRPRTTVYLQPDDLLDDTLDRICRDSSLSRNVQHAAEEFQAALKRLRRADADARQHQPIDTLQPPAPVDDLDGSIVLSEIIRDHLHTAGAGSPEADLLLRIVLASPGDAREKCMEDLSDYLEARDLEAAHPPVPPVPAAQRLIVREQRRMRLQGLKGLLEKGNMKPNVAVRRPV